jgi:hypothetical protein
MKHFSHTSILRTEHYFADNENNMHESKQWELDSHTITELAEKLLVQCFPLFALDICINV